MPRGRNWIYYAVCLLALAGYVWCFHGQRQVGALRPVAPGVSAREPAVAIRAPAQVDGAEAGTDAEVRFLVQRRPPGSTVEIVTGGTRSAAPVTRAFAPFHLWITAVTGLFFWGICIFVFAGRAHIESARVLFWGTLCYGLAIAAGGVYFPPAPLWPNALRPLARLIGIIVPATLFVRLGLVFPRRRAVLERRPWLLPALYAAAAALFAWQAAALLHYLRAPSPAAWRGLRLPDLLADVFLVGVSVAGVLLLSQSTRTAQLTRERQQAKWVWWGITMGASPFIFLYTLPRLLGLPEIVPLPAARVLAIVVPAAFAFAVARYQFMDIDLIIRRSLIYGALAGILVGVYVFLAVLIGRRIEAAVPQAARYVPLAAALVSVALFGPTRRWIGNAVDRTFFKIRHDYAQALRSFRTAVAGAASQRELTAVVLAFLRRTLSPKLAAVAVWAGGEVLVAGDVERGAARRALAAARPQPAGGGEPVTAAPNATSLPEVERGDFPAELAAAGVRLAQPLAADGRALGVLLLGEKESERRYIEQDLELLAAVAAAGATALERMELVQRVAEETIVRRRLGEIDRLKSDFLSRVAHDLRTPLTSIAWSADNLLDGVAGPMADRQSEYVHAIRISARQLGRLVNNLLEIARLETGTTRVAIEPVALAPLLEEVRVALAPIAEAKRVHLAMACADGLGAVRGNREKLVEVATNLIENALKYSPPGAAVDVTLACEGPGAQRLTVRDRGPGIPPGEEEVIFERFRQGAPSPHSQQQGFGLGLYVVKSYVDLFGGTVRARSHPDGGAEFVCVLPEADAGREGSG
jgi:signal transduction histidine kinase